LTVSLSPSVHHQLTRHAERLAEIDYLLAQPDVRRALALGLVVLSLVGMEGMQRLRVADFGEAAADHALR